MIERYSREEMKKIWDLQSKFQYYLNVEIAVCKAYSKQGKIPTEALGRIKNNASFSLERIDEIEAQVNHDVIAFLTNINETIGEDAKYMHIGLTSSDVIDTALALQIQDASKIIKKDLNSVKNTLINLAQKHRNTLCIGRSHGIQAEPMTFGVKMLNWLDMFERAISRFEFVTEEIRVGQISGPVGTFSNIEPIIEELTCEILNLKPAKISTQVIQRDYHANFLQCLALIASIIEQCAIELRHLQRTEVNEVEEGFKKGQKGSSAMPHKKNPISGENLCGLARIVRSNSFASLENIALWHERDISHSSAERIIFPDSTILVDYMLNRFNNTLENLVIKEDNMHKNAHSFGGIVFSQKVLLKLIEKGLTREEAYLIVQKNAHNAFNNNGSFKENLINDKEVILTNEEIEECFDYKSYLQNIDKIYQRFSL